MRKEKEGDRGHRPCEETRSDWFGCPHVVVAVAEVVRRRLVSNKLGIRAAKTAAGSSERGPSSKWTVVGETCGRVRRAKGTSGIPAKLQCEKERSGRRPRVTRECHSAVRPSPKAVSGSRDRGCNGHRILWRVPNDRRHPSPKRGVGFHEKAQSVGLAISASSDPLQPVKTRASGQEKETGNVGEARRSAEDVTERSRQGCQRLGRMRAVGRKRPRSCLQPARD